MLKCFSCGKFYTDPRSTLIMIYWPLERFKSPFESVKSASFIYNCIPLYLSDIFENASGPSRHYFMKIQVNENHFFHISSLLYFTNYQNVSPKRSKTCMELHFIKSNVAKVEIIDIQTFLALQFLIKKGLHQVDN